MYKYVQLITTRRRTAQTIRRHCRRPRVSKPHFSHCHRDASIQAREREDPSFNLRNPQDFSSASFLHGAQKSFYTRDPSVAPRTQAPLQTLTNRSRRSAPKSLTQTETPPVHLEDKEKNRRSSFAAKVYIGVRTRDRYIYIHPILISPLGACPPLLKMSTRVAAISHGQAGINFPRLRLTFFESRERERDKRKDMHRAISQ